MPKLFQINSTANWGSTGKIAEQIGLVAMENGWESYIAYGRYANPSKSHLVKIGTKFGLFWHLLESRLCDNHGLASRIATRKLVRQIESIKPDIIHLHNIHGYYLNYKILFEYLAKKDIPVVWTLHDCWSFTGHCSHFVDANCMRWKTECSHCPLFKEYPKSIVDRSRRNYRLKKLLTEQLLGKLTIVSASNWLANYVNQSYLRIHNVMTIHNGIDVSTFHQRHKSTLNNESSKIILGVASVWTKSKGIDDYISLRSRLSNDVVIKLVGLTKEQISSLPQGIIGVERTNRVEDLVKLYCEADVFVNPTYSDTFPTVNLEALACGTPVITYRTGGSPEAVSPDTGIVVEQGDLNGLEEAINTILKNGKAHYSSACRQRAEEFFDKNKCFHKYIELYSEILTDRNR